MRKIGLIQNRIHVPNDSRREAKEHSEISDPTRTTPEQLYMLVPKKKSETGKCFASRIRKLQGKKSKASREDWTIGAMLRVRLEDML